MRAYSYFLLCTLLHVKDVRDLIYWKHYKNLHSATIRPSHGREIWSYTHILEESKE